MELAQTRSIEPHKASKWSIQDTKPRNDGIGTLFCNVFSLQPSLHNERAICLHLSCAILGNKKSDSLPKEYFAYERNEVMKDNASVSQFPGADVKVLWHRGQWPASDVWVSLPHTLAPPAPSIFSGNTSVTALHSLGCLCFSEVCFCLCVSFSPLSWISPLFSLLYPVVIRGFFPPKPIWQTSFLAFRFHLQMSEWEIMVHCRLGAVRACWPGDGDTEEQGELWSSHVGQLA